MDRLLTTQRTVEFIDDMGTNDKVAVVLFDSYAFYTLGFTDDKEELKLVLQRIWSDGGTNFDSALSTSMNLFDGSILNSGNIYTRIVFLSDGEVIYSDPTFRDTDGDELWDGKEVKSEVRKAEHFFYEVTGKDNYYLDIVSYPNLADSDGDGLNDKADNRPLDRGVYSEKAGKMVVGNLTIVSSTYNLSGHSFLVYKSYINDTLDFWDIEGGYLLLENNTQYSRVDGCTYDIGVNEYVTLGNTGIDLEFPLFCVSELFDWDSAGNFFNREFAVEIRDGSKYNQVYCDNKAYSIDISERQKNEMISTHEETNYYDLLENNCARVAQYAWNNVVYYDQSQLKLWLENFNVKITPKGIKEKNFIMER